MGTFLTGYGEAGYDHEGYAAQVLDDGTITSAYTSDTEPRMIGQVVAACGCGWTGTTRYRCPEPFDEAAEAFALAEWETTHARPTLDRLRQNRATRLAQLLGSLAEEHRSHLEVSEWRSPRHRLELLDHTLRALEAATELARELRDEAAEAEWGAGR